MSKADDVKGLLQQALDKALVAQQPLAQKNVERLRRVHPGDTPQELIRRLDRCYLESITLAGGATGAAGTAPNIKKSATPADIMTFAEASALYVLSLAEVYGLHTEDFERRKRLFLTVVLGDAAARALDKVVGRTSPYWTRRLVDAIPMTVINRSNKILGPRFVTKYGTKEGLLVLSEKVALAIGAALSAGGNRVLGQLTIKSARTVFGEPPSSWADPDDGDGRRGI